MPELEKNKFSTKKKQWSSIKDYNNRSHRHLQKSDRENEKTLGSQAMSSPSQHQPTILLKNRDTKLDLISKNDRSVSPKVKEVIDKQNTQVHVEAPKVKSVWDKSYKLIEYENFISEPIQNLMDDTNEKFLVIGVMGKQGVGKSTFCNIMAQSVLSSDKIERIMKNLKSPSSKKDVEGKDVTQKSTRREIIFEQENVEHIKSYNYCTKGIHIYVTENNLILLDCQPVLSIAYQEESYYHPLNQNYEVNNHEPYNIKPETRHEITDLQHLTFLLSVCNIVVFMQDWFCDNEVTRLIMAASMLKQPLIIGPNEDELFDNVPKLMILHKSNKIEDYSYPSIQLMNDYYNSVFNDSSIDCSTGLNLGQTRMTPCLQSDDGDFNLYLMPDYNHKGAHLSEFLNYETSIKELKSLFFRFGVNNEFDKGLAVQQKTLVTNESYLNYDLESSNLTNFCSSSSNSSSSSCCSIIVPDNLSDKKKEKNEMANLSREERRRRRRATLKYRTAHATRERIRVEAFNVAFLELRKLLPTLPPDKKLSKIEILRLAICYIAYLNHVLDAKN